MLIATAGHVDHGKTTLVNALTGVNTDRLPEEKRRGVSIDIGFAYDTLGTDQTLGFIDVPGHEKFVRNMLAGVGAVDAVMLVIAADDGPMPQTREHLAIIDLLGIPAGVVVLSRADLVDDTQLAQARLECENLLASTRLAGAQIIPVSAVSGLGMEQLRNALKELTDQTKKRAEAGRFRLAIDRQFTVAGSGLVVTGTVISGVTNVGETLNLSPYGLTARVRALHVQNAVSETASAGLRCAVNLNATDLGRVVPQRGDWLTGNPAHTTSRRLDVELQVLATEPRALAHWTPIHLHHGAGSFTARVALLDKRKIEPGDTGLAQLVLDTDTSAVHGDRLILRDQSARRTIGGGVVIDPYGPAHGRARDGRIALLNIMRATASEDAFAAMLEHSPMGVDPQWLAQTWNLTPTQLQNQLSQNQLTGQASALVTIRRGHSLSREVHLEPRRWQAATDAAVALVTESHQQQPDQPGPTELHIRRALSEQVPRDVALAALTHLVAQGKLARQGPVIKLPAHMPAQSAQQQALWKKVSPHLGPETTRPPVVTDLAKQLNMSKAELDRFLSGAAQRGQLTRFAANRYFHPSALAGLAAVAERLGSEYPDGFDARAYRDASGIGRNLTIELLEYFDTRQLTRRVGDKRVIVGSAREVFGVADTEQGQSK
ncbi:MAG: selenocysteine-specific translation elongation factor [Burkholderiaceae bacterium]